ncbi:cytochrome b561 and DOMON domain-containing protein At4g12980-like [Cajanus cajan]|nr:cytochrome b561 and DOMON domain-containing protein At4g12980-like [Cajanus cajan]
MALCCLILLLGLFAPFHPIYAKISSTNELAQVQNERTIIVMKLDPKINEMEVKMHGIGTPRQTPETANKTTDVNVISYKDKGHILTRDHQRHFQNVYRILILIGWGTLLPIGVIIARYLRNFPVLYDVWFKCHLVCQTLGYILGTMGWCMWLGLGNSSKHFVSKTQSILSIIAFTFINVQMLATFMRLNKEAGYCKCWNICHHLLGYAIIGIVIANISVGFHDETLRRVYEGILGGLTVLVVPLEIYRCKTKIMHHAVIIHRELWNREGSY